MFFDFVGGSCCSRVTKFLAKTFRRISNAEEAFGINYFESMPKNASLSVTALHPLSPIFGHSPSVQRLNKTTISDNLANTIDLVKNNLVPVFPFLLIIY